MFLTYGLNRGFKINVGDIIPDIAIMKNIFNLGLPSAFGQIMTSLSFLVFNYLVIQISPKFLAAYGLTNSIIAFLLLPGMSIGTGIIAIVGQNLGAKNVDRVGDALKKGFFVSLVVLLTINAFIIFFREDIISFFTDDLEVLNYANDYLLLASIGTVGYGLQQVFFWRINWFRTYKTCYDYYLYSSLGYSFTGCTYFSIFWSYRRFIRLCFHNFKLCDLYYFIVLYSYKILAQATA